MCNLRVHEFMIIAWNKCSQIFFSVFLLQKVSKALKLSLILHYYDLTNGCSSVILPYPFKDSDWFGCLSLVFLQKCLIGSYMIILKSKIETAMIKHIHVHVGLFILIIH